MDIKRLTILYDVTNLNHQLHERFCEFRLQNGLLTPAPALQWKQWRDVWYQSVLQSTDLVLFTTHWTNGLSHEELSLFNGWLHHTEDLASVVYQRYKTPQYLLSQEAEGLTVGNRDLTLIYAVDTQHVSHPSYERSSI